MAKQNKIKTPPTKAVAAVKAPANYVTLPDFWTDKAKVMPLLFALLFTFGSFFNVMQNEFVNWDDDRNFYENEHITSLNGSNFWANTKDIFTSKVIGNYNPLTVWTFAIEKTIYGLDNPSKWHLTNLILHLLCLFFVYRICLLLGLKWEGAFLVATLFGIHPMRVESVAWVTERKDVLFGVFYFAAMYLYIKQKKSGRNYIFWILILFLLSLLSKIQAVILPLSMVAIDYYFDKKIKFSDIVSKWPFFILSLAFGIAGLIFLGDEGSLENAATFPAWQRIFVGSYSYLIYLVKVIVPYEMVPMYPYPPTMPSSWYPTILLAPLVLYGFYYFYKKEKKALFFGLVFFTVNIMFLLQILGAGQGFIADRFTYVPYFGLFYIAGYYLDQTIDSKPTLRRPLLLGVACLLGLYGYLTFKQNQVWKNSETLWTHVLKYYDKTTLPYGNRANYLRDKGRSQEALRDYNMAISLNAKGEQAYNSRARLFFDMSNNRDTLLLALQDYTKAIELSPNNGEFYVNRGATYARLGDIDNAMSDLNKGIQYKPDHAVGYLNRSVMYNAQNMIPQALADIESYLKLRPFNADLWYEKARALRALNKLQEAISSYDRAIQLNDRKGLFYYERSRTLYSIGRKDEAVRDLQRAIGLQNVNIDPSYRKLLGI